MKRIFSACLLSCLLLSLTGCADKNTVVFYYARDPLKYVYGTPDGVIASETRKAQGHMDDLTYLLDLYLDGPLDTDLVSPLPEDTELIGHSQHKDTLNITLYGQFEQTKSIDLTVASACLAYTCFDLMDIQQVTIRYTAMLMPSKIITITRHGIMTVDEMEPSAPSVPAQ